MARAAMLALSMGIGAGLVGAAGAAGAAKTTGRGARLSGTAYRAPDGSFSGSLARAIVGRWSYYYGNSSGIGTSTASSTSVSKTVTFYPNGRFDYVGGVSSSVDLPSDIGGSASGDSRASGTYRLRGSMLVARFDGGGQATFRVELVRGGALKINGMLFIRE